MAQMIFGFIVLFGFVAIIRYFLSLNKKTVAVWERAAATLGLTYSPGVISSVIGEIIGTHKGVRVTVDIYNESSGNVTASYTRYKVVFKQRLELGLNLTVDTFKGDMSQFRGQDIEVGDKAFDEKFLIKGQDPRAVCNFLNERRQKAIIKAFNLFDRVIINDYQIEAMNRDKTDFLDELVESVKMLIEISLVLDIDTKDDLVPVQKKTKIDAEINDSTIENDPMFGSQPLFHDQPLFNHEPDEVPSTTTIPEPKVVSTPKIEKETKKAVFKKEKSRPKPKQPAPKKQPPATVQVSIENLCDVVFARSTISFEVEKDLSPFKGKHVRWQGVLKDVQQYQMDYTFGNNPGSKAIFEIHEIKSDYGTKSQVKAIVELLEEEYQELRSLLGKQLEFTGKILTVEAISKEIYLSDGNVKYR